MKTCCCTGHRPKGFLFEYGVDKKLHAAYLKALEQKIEQAITEFGITHFISGMALGADMDFAEIVLKLRKKYPITLECAIPCRNQTLKWNNADKFRYDDILECADTITVLSEWYTPDCMSERNRYMVDKSDLVIAVYNGVEKGGTWNTINYAKQANKRIGIVDLRKWDYKKKLVRNILIGVFVFIAVCLIEFCIIYSVEGDNTWNYYKEVWDRYINFWF